jgi:hypothetical protein
MDEFGLNGARVNAILVQELFHLGDQDVEVCTLLDGHMQRADRQVVHQLPAVQIVYIDHTRDGAHLLLE